MTEVVAAVMVSIAMSWVDLLLSRSAFAISIVVVGTEANASARIEALARIHLYVTFK